MTFRDDFDSVKKKYSIKTYSLLGIIIIVSMILGFGIYISQRTNDINRLYEVDKTLSLINNDYEEIRSSIKFIKLLKSNKNDEIKTLEVEIANLNFYAINNIRAVSEFQLERFIDESNIEMQKIEKKINKLNEMLTSKSSSNTSIISISLIDDEIERLTFEIKKLDILVVEAQKQINDSVNYLIKVFLIAILLIILLCYSLLSNKIIKPLTDISTELRINAYNFKTASMEVKTKDEIGFLIHNYNYLRNRIVAIEELNSQINKKVDFDSVLNYLFDNFKLFIPYSRIGVAVLSEDKTEIVAYRARTDSNVYLNEGYTVKLEKTSLAEVVRKNEPRIINDLAEYLSENQDSESTRLILKEGMLSSVTLPLIINDDCIGVLFFSSRRKNAYNDVHINFLRTIANNLATIFDKSFMHDDLIISTIEGFASLVESKDSDTGNHMERMKMYSVLIAKLLKNNNIYTDQVDDEFISQIKNFSAIHDIGKVSIPDSILLKPGRLSEEEFEIMKTHAMIGGKILENMNSNIHGNKNNLFRVGIDIAMYHHEKWNGSGYPYGKSGLEIPLAARIVAVADVFDALMSKRPYKQAFDLEKAFGILENDKGKHFDPIIIDVVNSNRESIINIYNRMTLNEKQI